MRDRFIDHSAISNEKDGNNEEKMRKDGKEEITERQRLDNKTEVYKHDRRRTW